jgi:hypothetical protein
VAQVAQAAHRKANKHLLSLKFKKLPGKLPAAFFAKETVQTPSAGK